MEIGVEILHESREQTTFTDATVAHGNHFELEITWFFLGGSLGVHGISVGFPRAIARYCAGILQVFCSFF